jgi:excinuclease ABC subunit B
MEEIHKTVKNDERVIITTLTKRMAEELAKYLSKAGVRCRYIHSDVETIERIEILHDLRKGLFDVLIGVNLLREGIDLPEVSFLAILDADKEGFLRSERSLTQIVGRVARNVNGKVVMYADNMTGSMERTMKETLRRRKKQIEYNFYHGITPETIKKSHVSFMENPHGKQELSPYPLSDSYIGRNGVEIAAEPEVEYYNKHTLQEKIKRTKSLMEKAAKDLDFIEAARLRDELQALKNKLDEFKN